MTNDGIVIVFIKLPWSYQKKFLTLNLGGEQILRQNDQNGKKVTSVVKIRRINNIIQLFFHVILCYSTRFSSENLIKPHF